MKRGIDIVFSAAALVLLGPLMALLAIAVLLTSRGPAVIRQIRVGLDGECFELFKFRSMRAGTEEETLWAVHRSDSRVTRLGRIMRRTSLDELPQLLNVIRGEMSLVGPRPERSQFAERFARDIPGYTARHRVRVGLTGLAQVRGLRGDTSIAERIRLDNLYIDSWSLVSDMTILLKTIPAIVRDTTAEDIPPLYSQTAPVTSHFPAATVPEPTAH